jgi:hypothetical protein
VYQLLHGGRGVLLDLGGGHARQGTGWADRIDVVSAAFAGDESDDSLGGVTGVLIRPDGYVAWLAPDGGDLAEALHRWFGAPAAS